MAGSTVKIYYDTKIKPERNADIEDIESYLSSKTSVTIPLSKFYKHDLSLTLKLDTLDLGESVWSGDILNPFKQGKIDYIAIKNDTDTSYIYYFVIEQNWTASRTVTFTLALDTINSFKDCFEFTDKTVVSREHKSRFNDENEITYNGITYIPREFYLDSEGMQPLLYKSNEWQINDSKANYDWYLLYMANNTSGAVEGKDYPITAFLVSDQAYTREGAQYIAKVSALDRTKNYWLGSAISGSYGTNDIIRVGTESYPVSEINLIEYDIAYNSWTLKKQKATSKVMQLVTKLASSDTLTFIENKVIGITAASEYSNIVGMNPTATGANVDTNKQGNLTLTPETLPSEISSIETVDRSDTRIISIIKLPYCPVPVTITNDKISYPEYITVSSINWQNTKSYYYLQVSTTFLNGFQNEIGIDYDWFISGWMVPKNNLLTATTKSDFYESALYKSEYFQMKFVYDSFNYVIQNELLSDLTYINKDLSKPWYMKMVTTSTMNSRFLFDFNNNDKGIKYRKQTQDYPYLMSVARNNNVVTYNSEYVNYMRNGYNYDVKAKNASIQNAVLSTIASGINLATLGTTAAGRAIDTSIKVAQLKTNAVKEAIKTNKSLVANRSLAARPLTSAFDDALSEVNFMGANLQAEQLRAQGSTANVLALGQAFNGVTSIINNINSIQQTEAAFEQKQHQIKNASVSVAGSDDIDLLSYYSNNRMKLERWEVSPRMRSALFDLYYYQGYATNEQKKPTHNDRRWFDFLQCTADIDNIKNIDQRFIDDIKAKFSIGVTYYHKYNNQWDIDQKKENIETWIS